MTSKGVNIVLFSSGISERNGILNYIKSGLEKAGHSCQCWRDLFRHANDPSNIALLPMLIKKIPTFDYAVLICEGHDETVMLRDGEQIRQSTMRDNVLFEIGLCVMALGLRRVILLTDKEVHMPEDLVGINGTLALTRVVYQKAEIESYERSLEKISETIYNSENTVSKINCYIAETREQIMPMMVGAATSAAVGYVRNFVFRFFENYVKGMVLNPCHPDKIEHIPLEKIKMHICLPTELSQEQIRLGSERRDSLKKGYIPEAEMRALFFNYEYKNGALEIYDYPSTVSASYDTVKMILDISADDSGDENAEERFLSKELEMFRLTVDCLLTPDFAKTAVGTLKFLPEDEKMRRLKDLTYALENCIIIEKQ